MRREHYAAPHCSVMVFVSPSKTKEIMTIGWWRAPLYSKHAAKVVKKSQCIVHSRTVVVLCRINVVVYRTDSRLIVKNSYKHVVIANNVKGISYGAVELVHMSKKLVQDRNNPLLFCQKYHRHVVWHP